MQRLILPILTLFLGTAAVAQDTPPPEAEQPRPVKLMTVTAQSSEVSRVFFGRVKRARPWTWLSRSAARLSTCR